MAILGTIELSADILEKTSIGLWAFELDPGAAPRMYVNDTMLNLIGLKKQTTPEITYHAWYDHVDPDYYAEVNASVQQMISGTHTEVQYPWHHPDGHVMIVRCGGVRNYCYTRGIRIEGTHMNVSEVSHIEKRTLADLLAKLADNFLDVYFVDPYSGKFEVYACDSLISNDQIAEPANNNFFSFIAMRNHEFICPDDIDAFNDTFTQSNLIHLLESNTPSEFTARWRKSDNTDYQYMKSKISIFEENDGTKKLIIGVKDVTKEKTNELLLAEKLEIVEALTQDYDYVDIIELHEDKYEDTCVHFRVPNRPDKYVPGWHENIPYSEKLRQLRDYMVYEADRESFDKQTRREMILSRLKRNNVYYVNFRMQIFGIIHYAQMKFTGIRDSSGKIVRFLVAYINADKQMILQKEMQDRANEATARAAQIESEKILLLRTIDDNVYRPMVELIDTNRTALSNLNNQRQLHNCLTRTGRLSRRIMSVLYDNVMDQVTKDPESKASGLTLLKGRHIMIAEDNALNLEIAHDIFEEYGISIEDAENGEIAVEKCRKIFESDTAKRPDVIFMDCQMPVMNGYDATRKICELMKEYDERIPIIAMTANSFEEEKKKCLDCGMKDHVSKPIDRNELERVLLTYIR